MSSFNSTRQWRHWSSTLSSTLATTCWTSGSSTAYHISQLSTFPIPFNKVSFSHLSVGVRSDVTSSKKIMLMLSKFKVDLLFFDLRVNPSANQPDRRSQIIEIWTNTFPIHPVTWRLYVRTYIIHVLMRCTHQFCYSLFQTFIITNSWLKHFFKMNQKVFYLCEFPFQCIITSISGV